MNSSEQLKQILENNRTVAIVGLSADAHRPSNGVARYLQAHGYRIIPVNPKYDQILGERCYADLRSIPEKVDIVDVFRKPADCEPVAREAAAIGAKVLWLQLGVVNEEARRIAETAGLQVVMDRCIKIDHARLEG